MLKLKAYKRVALLVTLSIMPYVTAEAVKQDANVDTHLIEQKAVRKRLARVEPLTLKDFSGQFIFTAHSVGGLSGANRIGSSQSLDGQLTLKKDGTGFVNFGSTTLYEGDPGNVLTATFGRELTILITITNPKLGIGRMTFVNTAEGIRDEFDFITIRSKKDGKVLKIRGHLDTIDDQVTSVFTLLIERQL
jgi:hypothetical protein